jgi:hypothetical protein
VPLASCSLKKQNVATFFKRRFLEKRCVFRNGSVSNSSFLLLIALFLKTKKYKHTPDFTLSKMLSMSVKKYKEREFSMLQTFDTLTQSPKTATHWLKTKNGNLFKKTTHS